MSFCSDYNKKSLDSVDYSTIDELAEENVEPTHSSSKFFTKRTVDSGDDYDVDDDGQQPGNFLNIITRRLFCHILYNKKKIVKKCVGMKRF